MIIQNIKAMMMDAGFLRYTTNTLWIAIEKILRMVAGLWIGVWMARYLGPEKFGLLSYAQSFVALFMPIASLGMDTVIIRDLIVNDDKRDAILSTAFLLKFCGAFAVLIIIAAAAQIVSNDSDAKKIIFIISVSIIFQSFSVIDLYFQSKVLSRYVVFANMFSIFVSSCIKIVLIIYEASLEAFAWVVLFDSFVLASGFIFFYLKKITRISIKIFIVNKEIAASLLRDSWPLMFAGMASMMNMRIDQVVLGSMTSNEIVGNYAAAIKIAELWLVLPLLLSPSIYPAIISAKKKSYALYKLKVRVIIKSLLIIAVPFAVIVSVLSGEIVNLVYKESYKESSLYLSLYIWTGLPYVVFFVLNNVMVIEKLMRMTLCVTIFSALSNSLLNFFLIPLYGGVGAVFATLIATYSSQIIVFVIVYNKTKIFTSFGEA